MEFKIEKSVLSNALGMLNPYLEKKDIKSTTSNILIKSNGLSLTMYATDYEFGLKLDVVATDISDGEFLVNGSDLLSMVKKLKNQEIHINSENDLLTISQGRSKLRLETINTSDYPLLIEKSKDMKELNIDSKIINKGIKNCLFAIDSNNPKYELQCLLIQLKDNIKFVSTDTRSLPIYTVNIDSGFNDDLLITKKSILELQKVINGLDTKIYFNETMVMVESDNMLFFTKLCNGKYIDYTRVVRDKYINEFKIPKNYFIENINIVSAMDNQVLITFSKDKIIFESGSGKKKCESDIEIEIECEKEVNILCNSDSLLSAISNIDSEYFTFGINEDGSPFAIIDDNYLVISMPIKKGE